jgi:hypothetical protein
MQVLCFGMLYCQNAREVGRYRTLMVTEVSGS